MSQPPSIPPLAPRPASIVVTALLGDLRAFGNAVTDVVVPELISSYDAMFGQHGFSGTLRIWGATGINFAFNTSTFVHDMGLEGLRVAGQAALDAGRTSVLNTVNRQQRLGGRVPAQPPAPPAAQPQAQPQAQLQAQLQAQPAAQPPAPPPAPPLAPPPAPAQAQLPTGPLAPGPYSLRKRKGVDAGQQSNKRGKR
jgi:hypothetical protein